MIRNILIFALLTTTNLLYSQDSFDLKWKISKDEVVAYDFISVIENMDSDDFKLDLDTESILKQISDTINIDSLNKTFESIKEMKEESFNEMRKVMTFAKNDKNDINVRIIHFNDSKKAKEKSETVEQSVLFYDSEGVKFRGIIDDKGVNQSFYLKENAKLNIALYCALPVQVMNIGDCWNIDYAPFVATHHFLVESYFNEPTVSLTKIDTLQGNIIATITYDNSAKISGIMNIGTKNESPTTFESFYKAVGLFNISTGRWEYLKGALGFSSNGAMSQNSLQTVELIKLDKLPRKAKKFE